MADILNLTKQLREKTGISLSDCKKAVTAAVEKLGPNTDDKKYLELGVEQLRKQGLDKQMKKSERITQQGYFGTYVHHNGSIGVLVEVNCETDFVAKNDDFQGFLKKLSLHIAGAMPVAVSRDHFPANMLDKEKEIYRAQLAQEKKPDNVKEKILEGKVNAYFKEVCLLEQIMLDGDNSNNRTVNEYLQDLITKTGENIVIRRFVRWELGKD